MKSAHLIAEDRQGHARECRCCTLELAWPYRIERLRYGSTIHGPFSTFAIQSPLVPLYPFSSATDGRVRPRATAKHGETDHRGYGRRQTKKRDVEPRALRESVFCLGEGKKNTRCHLCGWILQRPYRRDKTSKSFK